MNISLLSAIMVDDDLVARTITLPMLEHAGLREVKDFESASAALTYLRNYTEMVHVIFSDFNMPEMNGIDFIDTVLEDPIRGSTVKFVLLTSDAEHVALQSLADRRGIPMINKADLNVDAIRHALFKVFKDN
jgi:two-component system, chemotaxis family, chemotaxis protein CheY